MKILNYIVLSLLVVSAWVGCSKDESIGFDIDNNSIEIDAAGGTRSFKVSSDDNWGINSVPQERIAEIEFVPKEESGVSSDRYACA